MAHPEGQRERPVEAPATGVARRSQSRRRADSIHGANSDPHAAGKMRRSSMTLTADAQCDDHRPSTSVRPARCPVASAATRRPLAAEFACPAVLRPARGRLRLPGTSPASRSRPARSRSGATATCCRCPSTVHEHPNTEPGLTRLIKADRLGAALGVRNAVGQGRHRQPDALVQGPRRRRRAGRRPRAGLHRAVLPVHRQPGQRRRRRGRPRRLGLRGAHPVLAGAGQDRSPPPCTAARCWPSTATTTTSTGSPPSSPPSTRTGRS